MRYFLQAKHNGKWWNCGEKTDELLISSLHCAIRYKNYYKARPITNSSNISMVYEFELASKTFRLVITYK